MKLLKAHAWVVETVDGGALGLGDFWVCPECGSRGGPVWEGHDPWRPFLAGYGSGLKISDDCDVAKAQIETARYVESVWEPRTPQGRKRLHEEKRAANRERRGLS